MMTSNLSSILVRCIHLFLDLPSPYSQASDLSNSGHAFNDVAAMLRGKNNNRNSIVLPLKMASVAMMHDVSARPPDSCIVTLTVVLYVMYMYHFVIKKRGYQEDPLCESDESYFPHSFIHCLCIGWEWEWISPIQEPNGVQEWTAEAVHWSIKQVRTTIPCMHEDATVVWKHTCLYSLRLLRHNQAVVGLLKFEDLSLLFGAISSPCTVHNKIWRKAAAETLMTICKHNLTGTCMCVKMDCLHDLGICFDDGQWLFMKWFPVVYSLLFVSIQMMW